MHPNAHARASDMHGHLVASGRGLRQNSLCAMRLRLVCRSAQSCAAADLCWLQQSSGLYGFSEWTGYTVTAGVVKLFNPDTKERFFLKAYTGIHSGAFGLSFAYFDLRSFGQIDDATVRQGLKVCIKPPPAASTAAKFPPTMQACGTIEGLCRQPAGASSTACRSFLKLSIGVTAQPCVIQTTNLLATSPPDFPLMGSFDEPPPESPETPVQPPSPKRSPPKKLPPPPPRKAVSPPRPPPKAAPSKFPYYPCDTTTPNPFYLSARYTVTAATKGLKSWCWQVGTYTLCLTVTWCDAQ